MVIPPNTDIGTNTSHTRQKASASGSASASSKNTLLEQPTATATSNVEKHVQLSSQAQTIERLEAKILAADGGNTAKVDQIKQQIADGNYQINSGSIAEKLIAQDKLQA